MGNPGFAVIDGVPSPTVEPFGLLDSRPTAVLDAAREWERHVVEVETGLAPGSDPGAAPRSGYDPATTTLMQRDEAKATELEVSVRTVQLRRARYARQGLWGLVDQRAAREWEATGRVDVRLVTAIREVIDAETESLLSLGQLLGHLLVGADQHEGRAEQLCFRDAADRSGQLSRGRLGRRCAPPPE
jgi:putative transposase